MATGKAFKDVQLINGAGFEYSNGRMASNRLTRNQIELLYKTDRIVTGNEAIKINDIPLLSVSLSALHIFLYPSISVCTYEYPLM